MEQIANRQEEINSILRDLYESNIYLNENSLNLTASMVVNYLRRRGIPDSEQNTNLVTFFNDWRNTFGEYSNLHTRIDSVNGFSFRINNGEVPTDGITLNISLDSRHIGQGVKLIFDYLSSKNIVHSAIIRESIRTDGIVIRLANMEDAKKLHEFISSSRYLQDGMLPVNSFYPSNNKIGYTYNVSTSYDIIVSQMIANYINRMHELGATLNNIYIGSFDQYINTFLQDKNNISELPYIGQSKEKQKDAILILELLKNSLSTNDINKLFTSNVSEDKEELFKELILTTLKKYPKGFDDNDPELSGLDYIMHFLRGNINGVPRDNNLRDRVKNNLTSDDIVNLLNVNHIPGVDLSQKLNIYVKMIMLNEMIRCSEIRFPNHGLDQVNEFINTGNLKFITGNVDNARNLAKTLGPDGIDVLFRSVGVPDIYRYAEVYFTDTKEVNYYR